MSDKRSDILQALALENAIRRQMDDIVKRAGETVRLLKPDKGSTSEMKENQIRNVLNVAEESKSVEVVTNFIRYQIGRSSANQQWQYNGFGLQVIKDIEEGVVLAAADKAAQAAAEVIGEGADREALCRQAYLELTRYYLGYLNRAFYFCDRMTGVIEDPWAEVVRAEEACQDV